MKFLLRHSNNKKYILSQDIKSLDCGGTMNNIFSNHKEGNDIYAIDLEYFDELDLIIITSSLKNIQKLNPIKKIYIIGTYNFDVENVRYITWENFVQLPADDLL
jgi:hypothetical protein